jgi:uncharacterized protein with HEPN domain
MRKDNAYLADMLDAAKVVRRFIAEVSLDDFKANEEKYEAVNRKFEIIGEAAQRDLPPLIERLEKYLAANPPPEN